MDREERLLGIYERGGRLRRRRRLGWSGGAAALVAIAVLTVGIGRDGSESGLTTTDAETATTTTTVPATTTSAVLAADGGPSSSTSSLGPTTTLRCRNSMDPRCGPLRYDPPPPDGPPVISVEWSPVRPAVGDEVVFTVTFDEPDRDVGELSSGPAGSCGIYLEKVPASAGPTIVPDQPCSVADPVCAMTGDPCPRRHGPWDPPAPTHLVLTFRTTWHEPGTFTVRAKAYDSGLACAAGGATCPMVHVDHQVTVLAASTTSTPT